LRPHNIEPPPTAPQEEDAEDSTEHAQQPPRREEPTRHEYSWSNQALSAIARPSKRRRFNFHDEDEQENPPDRPSRGKPYEHVATDNKCTNHHEKCMDDPDHHDAECFMQGDMEIM
jgi:hypothetical protein